MALKYRIANQHELYFVTFTVVNWIDIFIRDTYRNILLDCLRYCQKERGLVVGAWVIMTSHAYLIVGTDGKMKLPDVIRDLKQHTSQAIRKEVQTGHGESRAEWMLWMFGRAGRRNSNNIDFQFWQQGSHPVQLSTGELLLQRLNYIHNNPVESGFVCEPQHYKYSSAHDYHGGTQGLFEINRLD